MRQKQYPRQQGNLVASMYFFKAKQKYTIRKMKKDKWLWCILKSAGMKFRNKKKFGYGIPAYTGPFQALIATKKSDLRRPISLMSQEVPTSMVIDNALKTQRFYSRKIVLILVINPLKPKLV
jgi:hypothetical protein